MRPLVIRTGNLASFGSPVPVDSLEMCKVAFSATPATKICPRELRKGESDFAALVSLYSSWVIAITLQFGNPFSFGDGKSSLVGNLPIRPSQGQRIAIE